MYITMNRFRVASGREAEFEARWQTRRTYLDGVPGFQEFHLLRGAEGEYVSHSLWASEQDFLNWTESEAFKKAHSARMPEGMFAGPPQFSGYEVVLHEKP